MFVNYTYLYKNNENFNVTIYYLSQKYELKKLSQQLLNSSDILLGGPRPSPPGTFHILIGKFPISLSDF